jgi:hypothetical protein
MKPKEKKLTKKEKEEEKKILSYLKFIKKWYKEPEIKIKKGS